MPISTVRKRLAARCPMTLTRKQFGLIHVARKQLGLEDLMYRAVLYKCGGVYSATDLDERGFGAVMEYFAFMGFRSTSRKGPYGHRPGMATPGQIDMIRKLWRNWSGAEDERALNAWLEHSYHVSALRFTDRATAAKAIIGLKSMLDRRTKTGAANA